jgi:hypothetical protein
MTTPPETPEEPEPTLVFNPRGKTMFHGLAYGVIDGTRFGWKVLKRWFGFS